MFIRASHPTRARKRHRNAWPLILLAPLLSACGVASPEESPTPSVSPSPGLSAIDEVSVGASAFDAAQEAIPESKLPDGFHLVEARKNERINPDTVFFLYATAQYEEAMETRKVELGPVLVVSTLPSTDGATATEDEAAAVSRMMAKGKPGALEGLSTASLTEPPAVKGAAESGSLLIDTGDGNIVQIARSGGATEAQAADIAGALVVQR